MSKPESSSRDSRSQPLLTIQIHRGAAIFILVLVVISFGAFLAVRALNRGHEEISRQQAAVEGKTATVAAVPNTKPQDSGWQKAWRKDRDNSFPPPAEQGATEPSDNQNFDDSSAQQPPEEQAPQPVPAIYIVPPPQPEPNPESPSAPSNDDAPRKDQPRDSDSPDVTITLRGAGATFPFPIYSHWFDEFNKAHPEVKIEYQPYGSGAGIRLVSDGRMDFGATDGALSDQQLEQYKLSVFHIPTVLGGVVPVYNIPGVSQEVRFTPEILAGIFLGRIQYWDDQIITSVNPDIRFPRMPITVVHRSDGTAATYILTDYLCKVSPEWNGKVGKATSVSWPIGVGSKGNEGVGQMVHRIYGAIGYVDFIYAIGNGMPYGSVRNHSGRFVKATQQSLTAAAASANLPADFRASITDAPGADAYSLASFTWLLIPQRQEDEHKNRVLAEFLGWMIRDGQPMAPIYGYAPLPKNVAIKVSRAISQIRRDGDEIAY